MNGVDENLKVPPPEGDEPGNPGGLNPANVLEPKGGKSKEEIFLELAKLSQQSFENRRSYEWKVAFGLWTAIGLATYFMVEHSQVITPATFAWLIISYIIVLITWVFFWQVSTQSRFCDQAASQPQRPRRRWSLVWIGEASRVRRCIPSGLNRPQVWNSTASRSESFTG